MSLTPGQVRFLSDQYDAGVRAADDQLRTFFHFLEERGALDRTLLVLLSDHGEEFYEHGQIGHEKTLFIESLRVPLIFAGAGIAPATIPEAVGLVDVMPTLLELAGIEAPAMQGQSLVSRMRSEGSPLSVPRYSELDRDVRLRSLLLKDHHLIVNLDRGVVKLFDLGTDPLENNNLRRSGDDLETMLTDHLEHLSGPERVPTESLSERKLEELRALGYVD
jgi:arylsulfatase A-like enzyme